MLARPIAHLDFETFSAVPGGLKLAGAESYFEHSSAMLRCAAYDLNDGRGVRAWVSEPVGDLFCRYPIEPPEDLFEHVRRGGLITAWNSRFEELAWPKWPAEFNAPTVHPDQWIDTQAMGVAYGLPAGLALAAKALRSPAKLAGEALINKFCVPPFIPMMSAPKEALEFVKYNIGDVVAEKDLFWKLPQLTAFERRVWQVNAEINSRGVRVDMPAARHLHKIVEQTKRKLNLELSVVSHGKLTNADELEVMQSWINSRGVTLPGMDAGFISSALKRKNLPQDVRRVLEIRQVLGKKSVEKLNQILFRGESTGRLRGLFQYGGAEGTLRWAGRGPQPQNMPGKNTMDSQELMGRTPEEIVENETNPLDLVSRSLRALFIPSEGKEFLDVDYSAIEAVVIAEIAGEEWRREVFRTHGKIYEASAAKISGIPLEEILAHKERTGEHHPLRSKIGKPAELASGFGGGLKAWKRFGADKHLTDKEIDAGVRAWRDASPNIVRFWYGVENAAKAAIRKPGQYFRVSTVAYYCYPNGGPLCCVLPSGRCLYYHYPRIEPGIHPVSKKPIQQITFESRDKQYRWVRMNTYGGKLTENIVQATARDILAHALVTLADKGREIVLHVHDEVVLEAPTHTLTIDQISKEMLRLPEWAKDYPLRADGWVGMFYKKD